MNRKLLFAAIGILVFGTSCEKQEAKARRLHVEAYCLAMQARASEMESFSAALTLYEQALQRVDRIAIECPSSQEAGEMARLSLQLGDLSISELRNDILPRMRAFAMAEQEPLQAALLIAECCDPSEGPQLFFLVRQLLDAGRTEDARKLYAIAMRYQAECDTHQLLEAVLCTARLQEWDRFSALCVAIQSRSDSPPSVGELLAAYGDVEDADSVVSLSHRLWRGKEAIDVLLRVATSAQPELARDLLSHIESGLTLIPDSSEQLNRLAHCVQLRVKSGDTVRARALLLPAYDYAVQTDEDEGVHVLALLDLAEACNALGEWKRGRDLWWRALDACADWRAEPSALCDCMTRLAWVGALLGEEEGSLHIISSLPPAPQIAYNDSLPVALRAACIQRLVDTYKLLGDGAKSQALARHLVALRDPDARTASHYSPTLGIVAGLLGLDAVRPDPALVRSILVFNKT